MWEHLSACGKHVTECALYIADGAGGSVGLLIKSANYILPLYCAHLNTSGSECCVFVFLVKLDSWRLAKSTRGENCYVCTAWIYRVLVRRVDSWLQLNNETRETVNIITHAIFLFHVHSMYNQLVNKILFSFHIPKLLQN